MECGNYRGVSLVSHAGKVLLIIYYEGGRIHKMIFHQELNVFGAVPVPKKDEIPKGEIH